MYWFVPVGSVAFGAGNRLRNAWPRESMRLAGMMLPGKHAGPPVELVAFHKSHGKIATVTAVHPPARFGLLKLDGDGVAAFSEKPQTETDWINGGYFVFEPGILDYIDGPESSLERDVLERVAADGQLCAFRHRGFFQPMDTLREKQLLEELWQSGDAPWIRGS